MFLPTVGQGRVWVAVSGLNLCRAYSGCGFKSRSKAGVDSAPGDMVSDHDPGGTVVGWRVQWAFSLRE